MQTMPRRMWEECLYLAEWQMYALSWTASLHEKQRCIKERTLERVSPKKAFWQGTIMGYEYSNT